MPKKKNLEKPEESQPTTVGGRLYRFWNHTVKPFVLTIAVIFTLRSAIADWNDVPSQSMEPTILIGDRIFVNKLAYDLKVPFTGIRVARWSEPQAGEIVVFKNPDNGHLMVKRIAAVPGDEVHLRNNVLYVNGVAMKYEIADSETLPLDEIKDKNQSNIYRIEQLGDVRHAIMIQPRRPSTWRSYGPVTVPDDMFFVMGDNRDNSSDSRYFSGSFVPLDNILGQGVGLAFSLDHENYYLPRWSRFFRGLD